VGSLPYSGAWLTTDGIEASLGLLLLFPLLGALACAILGPLLARKFGGRVAPILASVAMVATLITAVVLIGGDLLYADDRERRLHQELWTLFSVAGVRVTFGLVMDPLAAVMVLLVTGLGTLIHVYAAAYMDDEPARPRFFAFLNLFVFSMLLLVLASGFIPLFFGWEGIGACSYFLIGFWYRRDVAVAAATKAFIVNRVGDGAFLLAIALLLWGLGGIQMVTAGAAGQLGTVTTLEGPLVRTGGELQPGVDRLKIPVGPTLDFRELRDELRLEMRPHTADAPRPVNFRPAAYLLFRKKIAGMPFLFVVCVLLFLGAAGKSAQIPLYAWLPDAMAGPTPVSALIHAATLVTAGVYLLARLSFLFALSPGALTFVAIMGTATAFIGATAALVQTDLKRVLAYSTVSQLGYMFVAIGAGAGSAGLFHVVTHGFFKACLFLAAGIVIHTVASVTGDATSDAQDLRGMGGLAPLLPWTRRAYFCAAAALAGLPIASGFFSKDQILLALATSDRLSISASALLVVLAVTSFLTALYAFRSYYLIFFARSPRPGHAHEGHGMSARLMTGSVLALALGAVVVGPLLGWPHNWTAGHVAPLFERFVGPVFEGNWPTRAVPELPVTVEWGMQAGGIVLALLGFAAARALYRDAEATAPARRRLAERFAGVVGFLSSGWGADGVYRALVVTPALALARAASWFDRQVFDRAVNAVASGGVGLARAAGTFDKRGVDGVVDGVSGAVIAAGRRSARLQNGRINSYVLGIAAGVAALVVLAYFLGT
jgi:NADH-quinone oxidoreductase subunit L